MRSRRAISSVVGMVFGIIALTTTITYVSYSMNILNNYDQSVLTKNQQLNDADKEKFQISSVTVPNGKLNVTVTDSGSLPVQFTKIWVQNTTATDWTHSYVPTNNFVSPGGVLTNVGQNIPVTINPSHSYNIKLVTSRGNTQQFTMNSPSSAKLNIQLMFLPTTLPAGFNSTLLMVVINNSTSTFTNITPSSLPTPTYGLGNTGNLACTASSVNPPSYSTLAPGNAAYFTWNISTSSGNAGDTCTFNLTKPLQNGYLQNISPPAPLTVTAVSLSTTTYAQNSGIVTMDYTSFNWIQTNTWQNDWQFPGSGNTATGFRITFNNNNQTAGYYLNMSKNTALVLTPAFGNTAASAHVPYSFFIVGSINNSTNPYTETAYNDYSAGMSNHGGLKTLYFASISAGTAQQTCNGQNNNCLTAGQYYGLILLYGKYTKNGVFTGGTYAQTIPFFAMIDTG